MRVIAGKARRIQLKTVEGLTTRPTTDRIKETLFNMLQNDLYDANFLDLFAGSGAIGIEALSRGAATATFVENNPKAVQCIQENLKATKMQTEGTVLTMEVIHALNHLENSGKCFDMIFMDPPYNKELEKEVLIRLENSSLINEDTVIIVEADLETKFDYLDQMEYSIQKTKNYKTNKHLFITKK